MNMIVWWKLHWCWIWVCKNKNICLTQDMLFPFQKNWAYFVFPAYLYIFCNHQNKFCCIWSYLSWGYKYIIRYICCLPSIRSKFQNNLVPTNVSPTSHESPWRCCQFHPFQDIMLWPLFWKKCQWKKRWSLNMAISFHLSSVIKDVIIIYLCGDDFSIMTLLMK